jgi:hypothetical protein
VLGAKAKEIIGREPGRYLLQGAKKFATTIGVAPYYFGTGGSLGHTNPLQRTELLPSMSASSRYEAVVHGVMRRVYIAFSWAYPLAIILIAAAWIVRLVRRDKAPGAPLISFYTFLALLFFGSLWFSWQVEIENSRNAAPYLPLWALMLAMAVRPREAR